MSGTMPPTYYDGTNAKVYRVLAFPTQDTDETKKRTLQATMQMASQSTRIFTYTHSQSTQKFIPNCLGKWNFPLKELDQKVKIS